MVEMSPGSTVLLLALSLWSLVVVHASPIISYSQESEVKAIVNALLQSFGEEQSHHNSRVSEWHHANVKTQKFSDLFKKVGSALCRAAYDPSTLPEAIAQFDQMDEAEIESITTFLKKFGSNLCDYFKEDNGRVIEQTKLGSPLSQKHYWPRLQEQSVAELQGFLNTFKKIGSALCRAAYDGSELNVLAEAAPSWQQMDKVEIEGVKDFFKRFGSNLCDYVTDGNGGSERVDEQAPALMNTYDWPEVQKSAELQGFFSIARNIGSALCKTAYPGGNLEAVAESFGLTDEADIQRFRDFLKRFGSNLCDYVTGDNGRKSTQDLTSLQDNAEVQGLFKKIASALCRAGYNGESPTATAELLGLNNEAEVQKFKDFLKRFGSNLCDYVTKAEPGTGPNVNEQRWSSPVGRPSTEQDKSAKEQGLLSVAKKIGSALCKAAYNKSPSVMAESVISWGEMDEVEAQNFKDLLKRFGSNLCDYITKDNGKMSDTMKNDLAQELMAIVE